MIVRILTATVKTERAGSFNALLRTQVPLLKEQPGLRYVKLARRTRSGDEEVLLIEEWRDAASLYAWVGPELSRARLLPGAEELVADLRIAHYEALDLTPEEAADD